jgi:hypothetical protein
MKDMTPKAHRCSLGACPAILEVTPQDLRCEVMACPSLFEVTPEAMKCGTSFSSCPAIYEQQDGHIIIGKVMKEIPEEVAKRIGPDEFAVWVPRGLVKPGDDNGRGPVPETIAPAEKVQGQSDEACG